MFAEDMSLSFRPLLLLTAPSNPQKQTRMDPQIYYDGSDAMEKDPELQVGAYTVLLWKYAIQKRESLSSSGSEYIMI